MERSRMVLVLVVCLVLVSPVAAQTLIGGEMPSEISSWDWRERVDQVLAPVFGVVGNLVIQTYTLQLAVCGSVGTKGAFSNAAVDALSVPMISAQATLPEMAFGIGHSLGMPIAMIRALQQRSDINITPTIVLVLFALGSIAFEIFVIVLSYLFRGVGLMLGMLWKIVNFFIQLIGILF